MTLEGHKQDVQSMHYFPDGKRMISGSYDKTTRQWDIQTGKEIEKAWDVCEWDVRAVAVSRDCRWVITAGGGAHGELKACEVETGIVKTFKGHSKRITCIDICADSTLFASGSEDYTTRIWGLDTGKLVAGPFERHTKTVCGLALSFDGALVASVSHDDTIKLWAFESRQ
ncbi:WD40 repeat-like protein, partial [Rhizopogon salebrosus TDB-379]